MNNTIKTVFTAVISMLALFSSNHVKLNAALSCSASEQSMLDWDAAGTDWPDPTGANPTYSPTLTHSETIGGVVFNSIFSSDQSNADFIFSLGAISSTLATPDDINVLTSPGDLDGVGGPDSGIALAVNPQTTGGTALDLDVTLTTTLSEPVSEFEFLVSDIDHSTGGADRQDIVTITGAYMGAPVTPILSAFNATPNYTITGNTASALLNNTNVSPTGTGATAADNGILVVTFDQPIDAITVVYSDGVETTGNVGGTRGINMMNDFASCPAPDVSGTVFTDADGDGAFSAGDTSISGVTVQIFADDGTGNPTGAALDTQVTDASGDYTFVDLAPGTYVIVETDPSTHVSVTDTAGANDNQIPVTVSTTDIIDQDFLDIVSADLRVTKDDSSLTYTPGGTGIYTIVVSNLGPGDVAGATVADNLPAGVTLSGPVTCVATGAASCTLSTGVATDTSFTDAVINIFADATGLVNFVTYSVPIIFSADMADYP